jgi:hypothetical protein
MSELLPLENLDRQRKRKMAPAMQQKLEKEFIDFLLKAPAPPPNPDLTSLKALGGIYNNFAPLADGTADLKLQAVQRAVFHNFTVAIGSNWNTQSTFNEAAALDLAVHKAFAKGLAQRFKQRPDFKLLMRNVTTGNHDEGELLQGLDRVRDSVLSSESNLPAVSRALLQAEISKQYSELLAPINDSLSAAFKTSAGDGGKILQDSRSIAAAAKTPIEIKTAALALQENLNSLPNSAGSVDYSDYKVQIYRLMMRLNIGLVRAP